MRATSSSSSSPLAADVGRTDATLAVPAANSAATLAVVAVTATRTPTETTGSASAPSRTPTAPPSATPVSEGATRNAPTPQIQTIYARGYDPGCCIVTVEQVERLSDGSMQLSLSFSMDPNRNWKGDSRSEYFSKMYLVDEQGRRSYAEAVTGPAAIDQPGVQTITGLYRFMPVTPGVRTVVLYYDSTSIRFELGRAAPSHVTP